MYRTEMFLCSDLECVLGEAVRGHAGQHVACCLHPVQTQERHGQPNVLDLKQVPLFCSVLVVLLSAALTILKQQKSEWKIKI